MDFLDVPFDTLSFSKWSFPEKNQTKGIEGIFSWKVPLGFIGFLFYPWKFMKNKASSQETPQNCVTPLRTFKA